MRKEPSLPFHSTATYDIIDHGSGDRSNVFNHFDVLWVQKVGGLEALLQTLIVKLGTANVLVLLLGHNGRIDGNVQGSGSTTARGSRLKGCSGGNGGGRHKDSNVTVGGKIGHVASTENLGVTMGSIGCQVGRRLLLGGLVKRQWTATTKQ